MSRKVVAGCPSRCSATFPALAVPLPRVTDEVLDLESFPMGGPSTLHVRIWHGDLSVAAGGGTRTVVLLGTPVDGRLIAHVGNAAAIAAHLVTEGVLAAEPAVSSGAAARAWGIFNRAICSSRSAGRGGTCLALASFPMSAPNP
jgi:hypothetical protein